MYYDHITLMYDDHTTCITYAMRSRDMLIANEAVGLWMEIINEAMGVWAVGKSPMPDAHNTRLGTRHLELAD